MPEPETDTATAQPPDVVPSPRLIDAIRRQPWLAAGIAVVLLGTGYLIGTLRAGAMMHTGVAYAAETQISVTADDWTYDIPLAVPWTDAHGTLHFGDRPSCLPASLQNVSVKFAAVEVNINGTTYRQVVWVSCPAASQ